MVVATGYAIVRMDRTDPDEPTARVIEVVWSEVQAAEKVAFLDSMGDGTLWTHFWQPTWVARRDADAPVALTPKDRKTLLFARLHGVLHTERPLGVLFSFIGNQSGAFTAVNELRALGWPDAGADEELTGDDCWHVYAHRRRLILSETTIAALRVEMERLAERLGGTYDGWDVSGGGGLGWTMPGKLPA